MDRKPRQTLPYAIIVGRHEMHQYIKLAFQSTDHQVNNIVQTCILYVRDNKYRINAREIEDEQVMIRVIWMSGIIRINLQV